MEYSDYLKHNKDAWNQKTAVHVNSDFYDLPGFLNGKSSLKSIELDLLGEVKDKKILHLQCHFGQDTLSLARMGAQVTGVDLSDKAIAKAEELNQQLGLNAQFVCCDVYEAPKHIDKQFDIVFTSYGTIGWLPDLDRWAQVINHFLKPGGRLVFAEFHPAVWMFDNDFSYIQYSYFNDETIVEEETGTYTDREAAIATKTVSWNHPLDEVINALLKNDLALNCFNEYDYSPYNCFNKTEEYEEGKFRIKHLENKIPMMYALMATKK